MLLSTRQSSSGACTCYSNSSIFRCSGVINKRSIPLEVNGYPIKAFVDSGAQQTIS